MRVPIVLLLTALGACGTGGGGTPGSPAAAAPEQQEPAVPSCAEVERTDALAVFDGRTCPFVLRPAQETEVELVQFQPTPVRHGGRVPAPCETAGRCVFQGVDTPIGPLVVAEVRSAESEVPEQVWLGHVDGERLQFTDLWDEAGPAVIDGGIALGPAHALAPYVCDGALALLAEPRLPGALDAPPSLRAREAVPSDAAGRADCARLVVDLP